MKCWKCSAENAEGSQVCLFCGISLLRDAPQTDTGRALRKIYDDFGSSNVLTDSGYIVNALSDLLADSKDFARDITSAYDVGIGKVYHTQLMTSGVPDGIFYSKVHDLLVTEAGFAPSKAEAFVSYFDEMIGWRSFVSQAEPVSSAVQESNPGETDLLFEYKKQEEEEEEPLKSFSSIPKKPDKEPAKSKNLLFIYGVIGVFVILIGVAIFVSYPSLKAWYDEKFNPTESDPSDDTAETSEESHYDRMDLDVVYLNNLAASSTLTDDAGTHDITLTRDGDLSTCWMEGNSYAGIGETLAFTFDPVRLYELDISNGNRSTGDSYYDNNRIAKANAYLYLEGSVVHQQELVFEDNESVETDIFYLEDGITCDKIVVEIVEVYEGTIYNNTAVSEFQMYSLAR